MKYAVPGARGRPFRKASCLLLFIIIICTEVDAFSLHQQHPLQSSSSTTSRRIRTNASSRSWRPSSTTSPRVGSASSAATTIIPSRLAASARTEIDVSVGECIGKGSYGVVHYLELPPGIMKHSGSITLGSADENNAMIVGKRALTKGEVKLADSDNDNGPAATTTTTTEEEERRARVERCRYYWGVEQHCFRKMAMMSSGSAAITTTPQLCIPRYDGTYTDQDGQPWMLFGAIPHAENLNDLLLRDQADHRLYREHHHHLYLTSRALGLSVDDTTASLTATLDVLVSNLLEAVAFVHSHRIVHRDIKPSNCLVSATLQRLVLIDFGSAADLDTAGVLKENIGLNDGGRVAVSPIYAAPELFVSANRPEEALKFDCFSVGLLICQLLFQYLEERTESGFRQQLERAQWDLDVWLQRTLQSKVRPIGIGDALQVLEDRPGFWRLLQDLLREDPYDRITAQAALERWRRITTNRQRGDPEFFDGKYLQDVFASIENCEIPSVRSLRFVATFQRNRPLGLYLAEAGSDDVDLEPLEMIQWKHATADAIDKEVFVQGTVPESQAEEMGIFEVGDRLNGIGELPFKGEGFERALEMLADQPRSAKTVTLHFDRKPIAQRSNSAELPPLPPLLRTTRVADQGAWSVKGRRNAQEDAFVLTEISDAKKRSIVLSAVFDGHLGDAASAFLREELPSYAAEMLNSESGRGMAIERLMEEAWDACCEAYRVSCSSSEDCTAIYDEREGVLMAYTGGKDAVAGSTGIVVSVDQQAGQVAIVNCGDSRALVIDKQGNIHFETVDHTPEREMDRFVQGREQGLDYNIPKCFGQWRVEVGDYDYAVARSLEGPFATAKGIVSKADVILLPIQDCGTIVLASDGLWEVLDSTLIARFVANQRSAGWSASQITEKVTAKAYENGSTDNISVVILFID